MAQVAAYSKGTLAWVPDARLGWIGAEITQAVVDESSNTLTLTFVDDNQQTSKKTIPLGDKNLQDLLPPLKNPPLLEGIDDLTSLSYLHEPGVLHNIKLRYDQQVIYTYSGIVLIAVNPYARLNIYSPEIAKEYTGKEKGQMEPHLFAVAEDSYRRMRKQRKNQSIIVSGESGSGKTVSARYIMRYLAAVDKLDDEAAALNSHLSLQNLSESQSSKEKSKAGAVEQQVLATNPIMEAFGNAKTTRNDNSSRFGKFIMIQFGKSGIVGAAMETYLLERSRVVFQPAVERNYHIFYQLCAGAPTAERRDLALEEYTSYHYLNQGNPGLLDDVDDAETFVKTIRAFSTIGIPVHIQWKVFRILAAILHIGNINITSTAGVDESTVAAEDPGLLHSSRLLGISAANLQKWITKKLISAGLEKILSPMTRAKSIITRDAVAKYIYIKVFEWLIKSINETLSQERTRDVQNFIAVLDIYGFEHFKKNSFEQFCINYANEKLQQEFNRHVFKLEQDEYARERIDWKFIQFTDNQACIELIEAKMGILDLLDETCRLASATEASFATKLYTHFASPNKSHASFMKPRFGESSFIVRHYAQPVEYDVDGFLEKNKDTLPEEVFILLQSSTFDFVNMLVGNGVESPRSESPTPTPHNANAVARVIHHHKATLGMTFKLSLAKLMETMGSTDAHYIRCIKPSESKQPYYMDNVYVLQQLRACGVLETIRISCAGYPNRFRFEDFSDRYRLLLPSAKRTLDAKENVSSIMEKFVTNKDQYQIGTTKVFLRAGQVAYLEKCRELELYRITTLIQKRTRGYLQRKRYLHIRVQVIKLQAVSRGFLTRLNLRKALELRAATIIQSHWRGFSARSRFLSAKRTIVGLQAYIRGKLVRVHCTHMIKVRAAMNIQRAWRGYLSRKEAAARLRRIVLVQACARRIFARRELKKLRMELRSVTHFREKAGSLEKKVFELTQLLATKKSEAETLGNKLAQTENQFRNFKERSEQSDARYIEADKKNMKLIAELRKEIAALKEDKLAMEKLHADRARMLTMKEEECMKLNETVETSKVEISYLQAKCADLKEKCQELERGSARSSRGRGLDGRRTKSTNLEVPVDLSPSMTRRSRESSVIRNESISSASGQARQPAAVEVNATATGFAPISPAKPSRQVSDGQDRPIRRYSSPSRQQSRISDLPFPTPQPTIPEHPRQRTSSKIFPDGSLLENYSGEKLDHATAMTILGEPALEAEIAKMFSSAQVAPPFDLANGEQRLFSKLVYPAHMVGLCVIQAWRFELADRLKELLSCTITAFHNAINFADDAGCSFWLPNLLELVSILKTAQDDRSYLQANRHVPRTTECERIVTRYRHDLEYMVIEVYYNWLKELKKTCGKMIIPAIVEHQSLPGFMDDPSASSSFFNKLMSNTLGSQPVPVEKLLSWMSGLHAVMVYNHIDPSIRRHIVTVLVRQMGTVAFNHVMMRKNFCTWRRGMQIQYNVTRVEEWCTKHEVGEASLHLEPLMQAAKLLQLNKSTVGDVEIMFDVCFLLSATQIKKLLNVYQPAEFETPITQEILTAVASRCVDENDAAFLLDTNDESAFQFPAPKDIQKLERYLPIAAPGEGGFSALQQVLEL